MKSGAGWLASATPDVVDEFLHGLTEGSFLALPWVFEFWALPHQLPPLLGQRAVPAQADPCVRQPAIQFVGTARHVGDSHLRADQQPAMQTAIRHGLRGGSQLRCRVPVAVAKTVHGVWLGGVGVCRLVDDEPRWKRQEAAYLL